MKNKIEISKFRMRSFSCQACSTHTALMGEGPVPTLCGHCGKNDLTLEWDQLIETVKTTKPYSPVSGLD